MRKITKQVERFDGEKTISWVVDEEDEVRAVHVIRSDDDEEWPWQIEVGAGEFVRTEPLETELIEAVDAAIRGVRGVTDVIHEDREVWMIAGRPRGRALARAVSDRLAPLVPRIEAELDSLA